MHNSIYLCELRDEEWRSGVAMLLLSTVDDDGAVKDGDGQTFLQNEREFGQPVALNDGGFDSLNFSVMIGDCSDEVNNIRMKSSIGFENESYKPESVGCT